MRDNPSRERYRGRGREPGRAKLTSTPTVIVDAPLVDAVTDLARQRDSARAWAAACEAELAEAERLLSLALASGSAFFLHAAAFLSRGDQP